MLKLEDISFDMKTKYLNHHTTGFVFVSMNIILIISRWWYPATCPTCWQQMCLPHWVMLQKTRSVMSSNRPSIKKSERLCAGWMSIQCRRRWPDNKPVFSHSPWHRSLIFAVFAAERVVCLSVTVILVWVISSFIGGSSLARDLR